MRTTRVILDRQHLGKPSNPGDHGATYGALRETDLTEAYIASAVASLEAAGIGSTVLVEGEYADRQRQAIGIAKAEAGRVLYVACHVNAGGGDYGLVEYDARSIGGAQAADALAALLPTLPGVSRGRTKGLASNERGFICLGGVYAGPANLCGVIFEPGFIDATAHAGLWTPDGLARVGSALAAGCA